MQKLNYHLKKSRRNSEPSGYVYELYGIGHMCNGDALYCSGTREECLKEFNFRTKDFSGNLIDHDLKELNNESSSVWWS